MNNLLGIFNIKPDLSMSKALVLFYLIIMNNYTGDLVSGQLKDFISHSRVAQHVIAFITLLVVINLFAGINDVQNALMYSSGIYLWFIFTTKLDLHWNLGIMGLLFIGYLNESKMLNTELRLHHDENVPEEIEEKLLSHNQMIRSLVVMGIGVLTVCGTYQYGTRKNVQYGGNFDPVKYMFCVSNNHKCCPKCSN